jgi:hypothetical protein
LSAGHAYPAVFGFIQRQSPYQKETRPPVVRDYRSPSPPHVFAALSPFDCSLNYVLKFDPDVPDIVLSGQIDLIISGSAA